MTLRHSLFAIAGRLAAPFDVSLVRRSTTTMARRVAFCSRADVNLVIDVGAATGEYAQELRSYGYRGRIISYEPLPDSFALLQEAVARDRMWSARQLALGEAATTSTLHVTTNRNSSSLLPMLDRHAEAAPDAVVEGSVLVDVARLDQDLHVSASNDRLLLKIDSQGFERQVISGAAGILDAVRLMELELSLVRLYDGGMLVTEMIDHVGRLGFTPIWFERGFLDQRTGELLQVDGIFARR